MPSPPPLIAFGWVSPLMLGWLAAAAAPVLIHFWTRRKHRETAWAAMEFLLAAVQKQSRRIKFGQWLLLAVRILAIVLTVLAVAEPYFQWTGFALAPGGHTHRVLVFDGSYSMAYKPDDKTLFDRAKELARRIVAGSSQGDAFTLVQMSSRPRVIVGTPALERSEIIREIDNLPLPHAGADLPATVAAVRQIVENARTENPRLSRHEVCFLTDLQRTTWAPKLSETDSADFLSQTEELANMASLLVLDLGQALEENLAVTGLRTTDSPITVGRQTPLEATLKDFNSRQRRHCLVELLVDGRRIAQKQTEVPPGGKTSVWFSCRFDAPGDHAIEVHANGDALDIDNHRHLAVPVRQAIRALCIDGRPSGVPFRGAADYLALALGPQDDRAGPAIVQAEVATESALLERNLGGYDCLFLCNVAQFTADEARAMDFYLRGGGCLVFFLGDQVSVDRYNRELGVAGDAQGGQSHFRGENVGKRDDVLHAAKIGTVLSKRVAGEGRAGGPHILPARLGDVANTPQFRLDPLGYRHPILQAFRGRGENALLTTPVFKYFKLSLPKNSPSKTVLALGNGDPLMVEAPVHRGRVLLVATSADVTWTAMPLWLSFVPLVQEIAAWCAEGQLQQRNLLVGEPIEAWIATSSAAAVPRSVLAPDGRGRPSQLRAAGDYSALICDDTLQSGIYVARFGQPVNRSQTFAVNVDTAESDLARVDPEELRDEVWPDVPFVHQTTWQDAQTIPVPGQNRSGSRLPVDLLCAVLGLLFLETFLAWKLGNHG